MDSEEAYENVRKAMESGHLAHAYLVVGAVRGVAGQFAEKVLSLVFGDGGLRTHPDIHRLRPETKTRWISVDSMRTGMVDPMSMTSYQGGWKAGVIFNADRMRPEAANTFLKTLEEPPPRTLFLLLTDNPEMLLPTIISRCQRIDLSKGGCAVALDEPIRSRILNILCGDRLHTVTARAAAAQRLCAILAEIKQLAADEVDEEVEMDASGAGEEMSKEAYDAAVETRYRERRHAVLMVLMGWFRDLMAMRAVPPSAGDSFSVPLFNEERRSVIERRAANLTRRAAYRNIEAVEALSLSLSRNVQEVSAFSFMMDRIDFGVREEGA